MNPAVAGTIAIALYLLASGLQLRNLGRADAQAKSLLLLLAAGATVAHGISTLQLIFSVDGVNFGVFRTSSLIFWVISVIITLTGFRRPVENVMLLLFPASIVSIACALLLPDYYTPRKLSLEIGSHVMLSILAYSVLTIATCHALLLSLQDRQLKSNHHSRPMTTLLRTLPPLQTMEYMLFQWLWIGVALLTLSIMSGVLFHIDFFAQHLVHKTFFTLLAWLLFTTLLIGHYRAGWRGQTAARWTVGAFVFLALAFFGSKMVLELVLHR